MIRSAKFADVLEIARLLNRMWSASKYHDLMSFDERAAKSLVIECIKRQDSTNPGGKCVYVSETDGEIDGLIIGGLDATYHVLGGLTATDLFFYVTPGGDPRAAQGLIKAFFTWAEACPDIAEITMGATDAIQDYTLVEKLYRRMGMEQIGVIYEKRIAA